MFSFSLPSFFERETMGRHSNVITALDSEARTASGNSDSQDLGQWVEMIIIVDVTAVSGTNPTLDIQLQYSPDDVNWYDDETEYFLQFYGVKDSIAKLTNFGQYVRIKYTIAGTDPSFTFSVDLILKD